VLPSIRGVPVLDFVKEPLESGNAGRLQAWLAREEKHLLVRVAESLMKMAAAEALNKAVESVDNPGAATLATDNFVKANRYRQFLEVLDEIQRQPIATIPYMIVKFK
jgi:hypothetical protein